MNMCTYGSLYWHRPYYHIYFKSVYFMCMYVLNQCSFLGSCCTTTILLSIYSLVHLYGITLIHFSMCLWISLPPFLGFLGWDRAFHTSGIKYSSGGVFPPQHCCVPGCTSDGQKDEGIHFHHITPARKKIWLQNIRRDEGDMFKVNTLLF